MVEFAGYDMPIQYRGITEEHKRVRNSVGKFDLSHMGEFIVKGADSLAFLQNVTVNDVSKLEMWQVQYNCMCYADGGIVDDLLVYRLPEYWMLVVNASNIDKDFDWLLKNKPAGVSLENHSDGTALIAVQGPDAEKTVRGVFDSNFSDLKFYWAKELNFKGDKILCSRTGYTGEDGFEFYVKPGLAEDLWNQFLEAGKKYDIEPIGLGARDSLRLEMKYMLYGNDIDQTTNPLEAGLGWITKPDKGNFIGREAILVAKQKGLKRNLVAFEMLEKAIPRQHYPIVNGNRAIGEVTSGCFSPSLDKGIGLGYVPAEFSEVGTGIGVKIRDKEYPAAVVKPPFW
ncbi:MAG: glycine cleavage system aminomethyltransferase GcvT, partial [candidate division Zixibacteria bacterium]|nr:glycine cleavage system aminomethyltransferase GcvT [candidate division Zixibacteria bacterium]